MRSVNRWRKIQDSFEFLLDQHVGIIRGLEEVPRQAGSADFFRFTAQACSTEALCGVANADLGGGAAAQREVALCKAIGEALERYSSAFFVARADQLVQCSYREATFPCIAPSAFALFSPEQYATAGFPLKPFTEQSTVRWIKGVDAMTSRDCWVPAAMVFVPYVVAEGETPIVLPISTGLAFHSSWAEAASSGICEVIERDAFTIMWQAMMSMPRIDNQSLSPGNRDLVARFEHAHGRMVLVNMTMDSGVPTILGVLCHDSVEMPALMVCAAANLDPEVAIRKCLEETALSEIYCRRMLLERERLPFDATFANVREQDDHINLFLNREVLRYADFLFASTRQISFEQLPNHSTGDPLKDLNFLTSRIHGLGYRAVIVDVTTPDLAELGFTVCRAIIPGFHPLFFNHQMRALGGHRLWQIPQRLGYHGISRATGDNPAAHPFP